MRSRILTMARGWDEGEREHRTAKHVVGIGEVLNKGYELV